MAEGLHLVTPRLRTEDVRRAQDDSAERVAALDVRASFLVEAPAGSGKTGLLVQRLLKLLAEDEQLTAPEEVLAMTFTRKATEELKERVLQELHAARDLAASSDSANDFKQQTRALAAAVVERSERLGWNLLEQPQRLNIRSLDAVCLEISRAAPLLAAGGGPYEPTEQARGLYAVAARRTLMELGGKDPVLHEALRTLLLHRDGNLANCEALVASMLEWRDQWGELVPLSAEELTDATLDGEVRARLERSLEAVVCAGLGKALAAIPKHLLQELTELAHLLGVEDGHEGQDSPIAVCAQRSVAPEDKAEHLDHWVALIHLLLTEKSWRKERGLTSKNLKFNLPKQHKSRLAELIDAIATDPLLERLQAVRALPPAKYPDDQWQVAKALFRVLKRALAELKVLFAERGECDYAELLLMARQVLAQDAGVADVGLASGGHLRHLLVDEMQDTSTGQYELIRLLTQSWDGQSQTLFLVGDPKQSIYLFRQARVERFLRTMHERRLGDVALTPLRLTSNFRSQAALVRGFNEMFGGAGIFPRPDDPSLRGNEAMNVPFVEAQATRDETVPLGLQWHAQVLGVNLPADAVSAAEVEAQQIRELIEQRLAMELPEGRTKPWQIAVLGRVRGHLAEVVRELKVAAIPFRAVELDPLDERPEVLDVLALTRALLHPADRIAWLALLRAPWCGLGRADLLALVDEGNPAAAKATVMELVAANASRLSDEGQTLLGRCWPVLSAAAERVGNVALSALVERAWISLGGDAPLRVEERKNVERFFAVLRELESEQTLPDAKLLTERLNKLFAEPMQGDAPVHLMTIHAAKGLEWDMVLLPALQRSTRTRETALLDWVELDAGPAMGEASVVLAPIQSKGRKAAQNELGRWVRGVQMRRERAEEKRLFYVATTRAKEELHLFGTLKVKSSGELELPRSGSLLAACWPAAHGAFDEAVAGAADAFVESADEGLALAAAAARTVQTIERLPKEFDPRQRFREAEARRLPYLAASELRTEENFERPEGSYGVRAFGNVVHRYLQYAAERMETASADALLAETAAWTPRVLASLRGEGLARAVAEREAGRAVEVLRKALGDATGRWLLSPHAGAANELALSAAARGGIRADRTFFAGAAPGSDGESHVWIVDFKTAEQGRRSDEAFEAEELAKYRQQLEAYAAVRRAISPEPIVLGLYYPAVPRLIWWKSGFEVLGA